MATKTTLSTDDLIEAIGNMSVIDLADFIEAFKEKFNVTVAAPVVAAPAAGAGSGEETPAEEKTSFTVELQEAGMKKIQVIKAVREVTSLGLKEAKELVDSAPKAIRENVMKDEAEEIKAKLEEAGATVELK